MEQTAIYSPNILIYIAFRPFLKLEQARTMEQYLGTTIQSKGKTTHENMLSCVR
jgi:hypothetical protein